MATGDLLLTSLSIVPADDGAVYLVLITFPELAFSAVTDPAHPTAGWFVTNGWYRQTYYAVSDGFKPQRRRWARATSRTPALR